MTLEYPNTDPADLKSAAVEAAGTSGKGVPSEHAGGPTAGEGDREFELLAQLQQDSGAKQRDLARAVGMSLGMTNALLKRLAAKGFITMKKANSRKIQYAVTPEGMQEAARRSRRYLKRTMKHVVRYKDTVRKACRHAAAAPPAGRGVTAVVLVGESDLEFIVEWCAAKEGLAFRTTAQRPARPKDDELVICSERHGESIHAAPGAPPSAAPGLHASGPAATATATATPAEESPCWWDLHLAELAAMG